MWYKVIDEKLVPPPVNFITPEGATICNFSLSPALMTKYGWSDWTPEEEAQWREEHPEPVPPGPDMTDFNNACQKFRQVCTAIGVLIGVSDFKGGFDEMEEFQNSEASGTMDGIRLAIAWSASNELCKYEGSKVGLGQPDWWYKCWEEQSSSSN